MKLHPCFGMQGLAVNQFKTFPPENGNLIAPPADFHCFPFGIDTDGMVDIIDAAAVPDAAIAAQLADASNSFFSCPQLIAIVSNLPASFIGNDATGFQSQPVIFLKLADCPDVNHVHVLPSFDA